MMKFTVLVMQIRGSMTQIRGSLTQLRGSLIWKILAIALFGCLSVDPAVRAGGGNDGTVILPFGGGDDDEGDDDDDDRSGDGSSDGSSEGNPDSGTRLVVLNDTAAIHYVRPSAGLHLVGFRADDLVHASKRGKDGFTSLRIHSRTPEIEVAALASSLLLQGHFDATDIHERDAMLLENTEAGTAVVVLMIGERESGDGSIRASFSWLQSMHVFVVDRSRVDLQQLRDLIEQYGSNGAGSDVAVGLYTRTENGVEQIWSAFDLRAPARRFEVETLLKD